MKYNIDKEKFAGLLFYRPGLIKKITNLNENDAAFFIKRAPKCYEYLSMDLKCSAKIIKSYIAIDKDGYKFYDVSLIPLSALDKLSKSDRLRLIAESYYNWDKFFNRLPNKTDEEWFHAVRHGLFISSVPKKYHTRNSLYEALAYYKKDHPYNSIAHIPEVFWEEDAERANKDLVDMLSISPFFIEAIPPKRVTKEHLLETFQSGKALSLDEEYKNIPVSSWDRGIVAQALRCNALNIGVIPPSLLTEKDALYAAEACVGLSLIPSQVLTRKVRVQVAARRSTPYTIESNSEPILYDVDFQCDVAKEGKEAVKNIVDFVQPENREAILTVCPYFIEFIPKLEQTDRIIDILLENASPEIIDEVSAYINLGKVKKQHAPLFVGCTSNIILSTVEKKLRGLQRKMSNEIKQLKTKQTAFTIEINVAPVDFSKIREQLDKMK